MSAALSEVITRSCENCPTVVDLKYGRFCDPCRSKRRRRKTKYSPTDFIDQQIRRIYQERLQRRSSAIPGLRELSIKTGWPAWALKKRGRALGFGRTKERPWSDAELKILMRYAWMCDDRIRLKLKAAGYQRTATAIHLKLKRTHAKGNTPYYTATGLAICFGVDSHVITRWIRMEFIKASRRGTERIASQGGDMWQIHERDVRDFILQHPIEFDIRKVDQLWFLNLITDGKVCQ